MPDEDFIIRMHEEWIEKVSESGMPLWLLDLYSQETPPPNEVKANIPENDIKDLPF
jgi:hypothetical protein